MAFIIIVGSAITGYWTWQRYIKKEAPKILQFTAEEGDLQEMVRVRGEVVAQKEFDLTFPFAGTVEKIFVREGENVKASAPLLQLDIQNLKLEENSLRIVLEQRRASLNKLIAGATREDLRVSETKVASADQSLQDARTNLENVRAKAGVDLQNVYGDARTALQRSANAGKNALLVLTDIQYAHFLDSSSDGINIASAKAMAVLALLGASDAGRWNTQFLGNLNGGAFEIVQNAQDNPTQANIGRAIDNLLDALKKVKTALDAVLVTSDLTATERTNLQTEKSSVTAEVNTITNKQQAIAAQKALNQNNIASAQTQVNNAQNALALVRDELALKRTGSRAEDIEIARAQIRETENQVAIVQEKISKAALNAPLDAKVVKIWLERKELALPEKSAISLSTLGQKIQADVSELDISKIRENNEVAIQLDALPGQEFKGRVISIEPREIIKEGDKYYRINVYFEDGTQLVRSGMNADLTILTSFKQGVLKIPELTIYERDGKKFVRVFSNNQPLEVEIKTGVSDGNNIEVVSGLREGQIVIVSAD
ncbi:MAG: Efflux transporter, RND family, MFP subunit [Parcubacteria group bacterium GW2011_GWC2_45_7]|nr:MAG: Efflux transporter, RND family, MFP subunit [Parcubacteria group bacterium GW2011_GWC2_45_7]KKU71883.1 MAG: Efflux transporter, RND family, MFP subunit [Parcubacteria group bacterium GW2011_GWA2_47_26]